MSVLAVISHTNHYTLPDGSIGGWGPTVSEFDHLSEKFDKIYHIAPLHKTQAPPSAIPYTSSKVELVPLQPSGGARFIDKFSVLSGAPKNLNVIFKTINRADYVQLRLPTGIGVYLLPLLKLRSKPKMWVKYAGNWVEKSPPLSYRFQRWWLKNNFQHSPVTINGKWNGQGEHLLTFENPCLENTELIKAKSIASAKDFNEPLNLLFVGRLENEKGVEVILRALQLINDKSAVNKVTFVGDGPRKDYYKELAGSIPINIEFKGFLNRKAIAELYTEAHVFLLPSVASEGFPKVIAEAAAYGAVPVVSNVSSIGQYVIDEVNGLIVNPVSPENLAKELDSIFADRANAKAMSGKVVSLAEKFTFDHYNKRVMEDILPRLNKEFLQ